MPYIHQLVCQQNPCFSVEHDSRFAIPPGNLGTNRARTSGGDFVEKIVEEKSEKSREEWKKLAIEADGKTQIFPLKIHGCFWWTPK